MPMVILVLISLRLLVTASPVFADVFTVPVEYDNVHFSQFKTDELHQEPIMSPDGTKLAYIFVEDEDHTKRRLWITDMDGTNRRPLVVDPVPHIQAYPAWSPDGHHIAYLADRDGETAVWIVAVDGGEPRRITDGHLGRGVFQHKASWASDSRRILVDAEGASGSSLLSYDIGSGIIDTLYVAADQNPIFFPSWAPDDKTICFTANRHESGDLWVLDLVNGQVEPLPSDGVEARFVVHSPDGRWLAFQADPGPQIYVMPVTGGKPLLVSESSLFEAARTVSWGPDSRQLLFTGHPPQEKDSQEHLAVIDTSGVGLRIILSDEELGGIGNFRWGPPAWSPDGRTIAFVASDTMVSLVDADGGNVRSLVRGRSPTFSPDGSEIAYIHDNTLWTTALDVVDPYPVMLPLDSNFGNGVRFPKWSPDGDWIVYQERGMLWRVSAFGGEPLSLFQSAIKPVWPVNWVGDSTFVSLVPCTEPGAFFGCVAQTVIGTDQAPVILEENRGWFTDVASDFGYVVAVSRTGSLKLTFSDFSDEWVVQVEDAPDDVDIFWLSVSPSNTEIALILSRGWVTHTWHADISGLLDAGGMIP